MLGFRRIVGLFTIGMLSLLPSYPGALAQDISAGSAVVVKSVVKVWNQQIDGGLSSGTGFVVAVNGPKLTVITARHVVEKARKVTIDIDRQRNTIPARVVALAANKDLAMIEMTVRGDPLPAVRFASVARPIVQGKFIAFAGFSNLQDTEGVIDQGTSSRSGTVERIVDDARLLMLDNARVEEGFSGGPLFDPVSGEVYGIVVRRSIDGRGGFAISAPVVLFDFLRQEHYLIDADSMTAHLALPQPTPTPVVVAAAPSMPPISPSLALPPPVLPSTPRPLPPPILPSTPRPTPPPPTPPPVATLPPLPRSAPIAPSTPRPTPPPARPPTASPTVPPPATLVPTAVPTEVALELTPVVIATPALVTVVSPELKPITDEAEALLARHRAFVGWQYGDGVISNLRIAGEFTRNGTRIGGFRSTYSGAQYRDVQFDDGGETTTTGFNGRTFYTSDRNGFAVTAKGDDLLARVSVNNVILESFAVLPGTIVQRGVSVNGRSTNVVRVVPNVAFPIDLYIDPQLGSLQRFVIDPEGPYRQVYDVLAYSEPLPGYKVISNLRRNATSIESVATKIEANEPIGFTDLQLPKARAQWTYGSGEIPIVVSDQGVEVDAMVNGVRGRFLLDTGTSSTAISRRLLRDAHAAPDSDGYYRIDTLGFSSGTTLSNVLVTDRFSDAAADRLHIDGVLGFSFFAAGIVDLNLDAATMRIADPSTPPKAPADAVVIPIDPSGGTPRGRATIDGHAQVVASFDIGQGLSVVYGSDLANRQRLVLDGKQQARALRSDGSVEVMTCGTLRDVAVGSIHVASPDACELPSKREQFAIGYQALQRFNLRVDYPNGVIILTPRQGPTAPSAR